MSDYYHYTLNFLLRRDTPPALIGGLQALSDGRLPREDEVDGLPTTIRQYLLWGDNVSVEPGVFSTRLGATGHTFKTEAPGDACWRLHYERVFHDDEFWNEGMYLIYWLVQFAAEDGQLGIMQLEFDKPPEILTKHGDEIITTTLAYNPEEHRALSYREGPLDAEAPIVVERTSRQNLPELLGHIAFMADGIE